MIYTVSLCLKSINLEKNHSVMRFKLLFFLIIMNKSLTIGQTDTYKVLDSIYTLQAEYYNSNEFQKIIDLSYHAQQFELNNAQDSILMARVTAYIGYANNKFKNYYKSIDGFKTALNYIPSEKSKGIVRTNYFVLYDLMTRYYSLRQYEKALENIEKAEELLSEEYFDDSVYFTFYQRKFRTLSALGYYDRAKKELMKLKLKLSKASENTQEQMRYGWMRYYRMSLLANYNEALYIMENNKNYLKDIVPFTKDITFFIGKLDSIYNNTKTLQNPKSRRQFWNLSYYAGALYYTSDYFKEIEDFETSRLYIDKTITIAEKANEPMRNLVEYQRFKANLFGLNGEIQKAITTINAIEKKYDSKNYNVTDLEVFKGDIYAREKNLDSTMFYYNKTVSIMHDAEDSLKADYSNFSTRYKFPNDVKQIDHMSYMLMTNFTKDKKAQIASKALNKLAYQEFLAGQKNLDLSLGNKQLFYDIIHNKIFLNKEQLEDKNSFISNIENISNELAWKQFSESRNIVQLPVIDSIENIEYNIRNQLVEAKKQKLFRLQDSLENVLSIHQKELLVKYPKISTFVQSTFDITQFQNQLDNDILVLKYLFFLDQFAIISISNSDIKIELKAWNKKEQDLLATHLALLKNQSSSLKPNDSLSSLLLPRHSEDYNSIVIIPDMPISELAFETLWYKDNYLILEKEIHYSSHLRFIINSDDGKRDTFATIFAPDYPKGKSELVTRSEPIFLEGAQKEAKALGKFFSSESFIGNRATKDNFILNKSRGSILHLAMHASVDDIKPELSYFNFSNNEKLFLEELYALKIPAELAVLSACNTGIGKANDVSGMASLQRAFNYAGTKATIASLWEVPDESTSQIMISFYEYLKEGKNKSSALQQAKIDYLENTNIEKLKHPYYWAGFVLYGNNSPIVETSYSWVWFIMGFIGVSLLLVFFQNLKKRINK